MTRATTVWEITKGDAEPKRLADGKIDVEKTLEDWVEKHPDLVEPGLRVLARQFQTEGGPVDLLCVDVQGRLVIVELKREDAYRLAFAQVLDYAACVAQLSYVELKERVDSNREKRGDKGTLDDILTSCLGAGAKEWTPDATDPRLVLVGTGADESLRRIIDYITTKYDVPVNGVFFDVSTTAAGNTILVRSAVVADDEAAKQGRGRGRGGMSHDHLLAIAIGRGVEALVSPILSAWQDATKQQARPERARCWTLGTKGDGRTPAAKLFPEDDNAEVKTAWLKLVMSNLGADLKLDDAALKASLAGGNVRVQEDGWVELPTSTEADAFVAWVKKAYA